MEIPRLIKIVVNIGLSDTKDNPGGVEKAQEELALITGQHPVITRAKKAISNFKIRKGMPIGCKVTLRRERMWEFLDRLVNVAIPRIRDFKGLLPKGFAGNGNYNLGIKEQLIFPEIEYDKIDKPRGMNITIVTTAKTQSEAKGFLELLGMPFKKGKR